MVSNELGLTEQHIDILEKMLIRSGAKVRYDLLGTPNVVIFDLDALLKYTDLVLYLYTATEDLPEEE